MYRWTVTNQSRVCSEAHRQNALFSRYPSFYSRILSFSSTCLSFDHTSEYNRMAAGYDNIAVKCKMTHGGVLRRELVPAASAACATSSSPDESESSSTTTIRRRLGGIGGRAHHRARVENTEAIYVLSKAMLTVLCLRTDDDGLCGLRVGGGAGNVRGLARATVSAQFLGNAEPSFSC